MLLNRSIFRYWTCWSFARLSSGTVCFLISSLFCAISGLWEIAQKRFLIIFLQPLPHTFSIFFLARLGRSELAVWAQKRQVVATRGVPTRWLPMAEVSLWLWLRTKVMSCQLCIVKHGSIGQHLRVLPVFCFVINRGIRFSYWRAQQRTPDLLQTDDNTKM